MLIILQPKAACLPLLLLLFLFFSFFVSKKALSPICSQMASFPQLNAQVRLERSPLLPRGLAVLHWRRRIEGERFIASAVHRPGRLV